MKIAQASWWTLLAVVIAGTPVASAIAAPPEPQGQTPQSDDLPSEPMVAQAGNASAMRLHIGNTGIKCLRLPCPSRGVFVPPKASRTTRPASLYSDVDGKSPPPPMVGDAVSLAAITTAWNERRCLAIDGRLISGEEDRPVLRVDRIVGPCRDQPG